jgi:transcriptional regulator with XRE-family HTH domain
MLQAITQATGDNEKPPLPHEKMAALLRSARAYAGLTQLELGAMIGVYLHVPPIGQSQISRWESGGEVPGYYLGAIAKSCRVEMSFFEV